MAPGHPSEEEPAGDVGGHRCGRGHRDRRGRGHPPVAPRQGRRERHQRDHPHHGNAYVEDHDHHGCKHHRFEPGFLLHEHVRHDHFHLQHHDHHGRARRRLRRFVGGDRRTPGARGDLRAQPVGAGAAHGVEQRRRLRPACLSPRHRGDGGVAGRGRGSPGGRPRWPGGRLAGGAVRRRYRRTLRSAHLCVHHPQPGEDPDSHDQHRLRLSAGGAALGHLDSSPSPGR